ncbi:MAG: S1 RNA-binding domain-containing protein [Chloroflexi bacterium]|nr:S1 RNA-binding domain-containing protein [Chloroflexota bacterium]
MGRKNLVNELTYTESEAGHPMDFLLGEDFNLPAVGETRKGWVVAHRNNEILVDIGAKSEGIIPMAEVQTLDANTRDRLAVGNEVHVYVVSLEDEQGNLIVSFTKAVEYQDWSNMEHCLRAKEACQGQIAGYNKGGLLVQIGQLRGFVPKSQFSRERQQAVQQSPGALQKSVGQPITVKVVEVDAERNRLILSEKDAASEIRQGKRTKLLSEIKEGDVFNGRVINIANFGAFVDIGGLEGLIHLSEISWKRINNPNELLKTGQEVKVQVLSIDQEKERLALSMKRLQPDPWTTIDEHYQVGQLFDATLTKLAPYGAFARLHDDYQLEGLIHISEISETHVTHPRDIVKVGQVVSVRIIRIDAEQRQLGLSIRQVVSPKFVESDLALISDQ